MLKASIIFCSGIALCFPQVFAAEKSFPTVNLKERLSGKQLDAKKAEQIYSAIRSNIKANATQEIKPCLEDEATYTKFEATQLFPIMKTLAASPEAAVTPDFSVEGSFSGSAKKHDDVKVNSWTVSQKSESVKQLFALFKDQPNLDFTTYKYKILKVDKKKTWTELLLSVGLDVRGKDLKSQPLHAYGNANMKLVQQDGVWKVKNIQLLDGTTVALDASQSYFKSQDAKTTFQGTLASHLRVEAIRRGGYALAVNDMNNDSYPDILVGSSKETQLYVNNKDGTFKLSSFQPSETLVKSAAFIDADNDGDQDLMLVRFVPQKFNAKTQGPTSVVWYEQLADGTFKLKDVLLNKEEAFDRAMPAAVADFDNDGLIDYYVGYPGVKDFTHTHVEKKLGSHGFYFGNKNLAFTPLPFEQVAPGFSGYSTYPHSAMSADYNDDGRMDLLVIDDRHGLSSAFKNLGDRKFTQEAREIGIGNNGAGMAVAMADINGDGLQDLVMTNVNVEGVDRWQRSCYENGGEYSEYLAGRAKSLRVFLGMKNNRFQEIDNANMGLAQHGHGLSGVRFFDYDNDGKLDLYVTNGLWSGTNPAAKFDSIFQQAHKVEGRIPKMNSQVSLFRSNEETQSVFMDVLAFFKGDALTGKASKDGERFSLAGFQRNRLFKNIDGTFVDVGYVHGVDSIADGYMVGASDLNKDGKTDLVLRNADPGTADVNFSPIEIFMNTAPNANALDLKLVGTKSNADAIGAKVYVRVGKNTSYQQLIGLDGTIQSTKVMHFGLANSKSADHVKIVWPSGQVTEKKGLKAGFHKITEPTDVRNISKM